MKTSDGTKGWGRGGGGGFYCCKPATKLGFELWSGRFRLLVVGQFEYLESVKQSLRPRLDFNWLTHRHHSAVTNPCHLFIIQHDQSLKASLAAAPWRAWWTTWRMTRGTAKQWTDTVPFISWTMITMRMMKRWEFYKSPCGGNANKHLIRHLELRIYLLNSKITMAANLFPPHRGLSFDGPLLTPVSWKQWRKQPRTSVTTWTLPKAWTPTKTRSITLQTAWPHLCDLLTSHVFTSCISWCCPAQPLLFPPSFGWPTTPPQCGLPLLFYTLGFH